MLKWHRVAGVLALTVFSSGALFAEQPRADDSLSRLQRRTVLLNFVNGLHLTVGQLDSLTMIAREADSLRAVHEAAVRTAGEPLERALRAMQPLLLREAPIPDSLKRAVHRAKSQLDAERSRFDAAMEALGQRAVKVLSPNQLYLTRSFRPCLVPTTIGAIGQDRGAVPKHLEKTLRRLREVPDWRYSRLRDRVVSARISREQREGRLTDSTEVVERRRSLQRLLDEIRRMDEPEFLRELPDLAEAFEKPASKKRHQSSAEIRAVRFLLDPEILPILEARRAVLAAHTGTTGGAEVH